MKNQSNEQLCTLAQKGNRNARDLLLENNFGFIRKTANEIYIGMNLGESGLSIDKDDLEQEGCIGLLDAIPRFDSSKDAKFLTYAAPSIRNAMTDLIPNVFSQFEQRMTESGRRLTIGSPADLPQNRAYRSGTRLLPCLRTNRFVIRTERPESRLLKPCV